VLFVYTAEVWMSDCACVDHSVEAERIATGADADTREALSLGARVSTIPSSCRPNSAPDPRESRNCVYRVQFELFLHFVVLSIKLIRFDCFTDFGGCRFVLYLWCDGIVGLQEIFRSQLDNSTKL